MLFEKSGNSFDGGRDVLVGRAPGLKSAANLHLELATAIAERLESSLQ
jgi:hypothetical protein